MDRNDLKSMWRDFNYTKRESNLSEGSIKKIIALKHCRVISKSILDVKIKVLLYALILLIYAGLMLYAFVWLRLNLSVNSLVPLALAGIFLLICTTSEFARLLVLTRTADNISLKDSSLVFYKKLKRIKATDFIIYLVVFYSSAILIIYNYLEDIGGFKNLSWHNEIAPVPLLGILLLMLLSVPWFIKYLNNRRYKKLFTDFNDSVHQLNDQ